MQLQGAEKAAVFLLSLPEERSVQILKHFAEDELQHLRAAMENLGPIGAGAVDGIYSEFADAFKKGLTSMRGSSAYLQSLVSKSHGESQAVKLFAPPELALPAAPPPPQEGEPLARLEDVDPSLLTVALADEHPQVAAVVLAHVEVSLAGAVLDKLPASVQSDLVRRIAKLTTVSGLAFEDAQRVLGGLELKSAAGEIDGLGTAAAILNQLAPPTAESLLEKLAEDTPEEVDFIRRAMFTFENLTEADTRGMQALLREVPSDTLLAALKTASDALKDKIFSCMSSRAAEMLREELDIMAPMRVAQVEEAQRQVVDVAMRLLGEGKIVVEGRGEGMV